MFALCAGKDSGRIPGACVAFFLALLWFILMIVLVKDPYSRSQIKYEVAHSKRAPKAPTKVNTGKAQTQKNVEGNYVGLLIVDVLAT